MESRKFTLHSGEIIRFEMSTAEGFQRGGEGLVSAGEKEKNFAFKSAISSVKPLAEDLISVLTSLSKQPDEVEVKFGIKLNAEAGVIVAKTATEAHFEICLKWSGGHRSEP